MDNEFLSLKQLKVIALQEATKMNNAISGDDEDVIRIAKEYEKYLLSDSVEPEEDEQTFSQEAKFKNQPTYRLLDELRNRGEYCALTLDNPYADTATLLMDAVDTLRSRLANPVLMYTPDGN